MAGRAPVPQNELIDGRLVVDGRRADLANITCPLFLLAGARDHITPPAQLFAAADAVGTPAGRDRAADRRPAGTSGCSPAARRSTEDWPVLMAEVYTQSISGLARGA